MNFKRRGLLCTIVVCLTLSSGSAHEGASGVVKHRMEKMKAMASALKALKKSISDRDDIALAKIRQHTKKLTKHAQESVLLFPKLSNGHPSEARDLIWKEWDKFTEANNRLITALEVLGGRAGQSDLTDAFNAVGQACKSCHQTYRLKK